MKGLAATLLVFGSLSAVLYSGLLPLWEGFDEPFHYAYVRSVSTRGALPVLGRAPVSREIWRSIRLAPASHVVRQNLPFVTTFSEYFALPGAERTARRRELSGISPALRDADEPGAWNYEAQQAPLAYLLLAPLDRLWRQAPLPERILRLRLVCALLACWLEILFTLALARELRLSPAARYVALFLVLSAQVFWASVAHIANDWLAIPLVAAALLALLRFHRAPNLKNGALLGFAFAAGLLAKAYFLSWAAFAGAVVAWMAVRRPGSRRPALLAAAIVALLAGPWYLRNLALYGSLSGLQQIAAGVGLRETAQAAMGVSWPKAALSFARACLWTGNNSFTTFSSATLNVALLLLALAVVLWARSARRAAGRGREWLVALSCLFYLPALAYACAVFLAYSKNSVFPICPWYAQPLGAPLACLVGLGITRSGRLGRWLGAATLGMAAYLVCATYAMKLIPLYGGFVEGRVRMGALWRWYAGGTHQLGVTALVSPGVIWTLTAGVLVSALALAGWLGWLLQKERAG